MNILAQRATDARPLATGRAAPPRDPDRDGQLLPVQRRSPHTVALGVIADNVAAAVGPLLPPALVLFKARRAYGSL